MTNQEAKNLYGDLIILMSEEKFKEIESKMLAMGRTEAQQFMSFCFIRAFEADIALFNLKAQIEVEDNDG